MIEQTMMECPGEIDTTAQGEDMVSHVTEPQENGAVSPPRDNQRVILTTEEMGLPGTPPQAQVNVQDVEEDADAEDDVDADMMEEEEDGNTYGVDSDGESPYMEHANVDLDFEQEQVMCETPTTPVQDPNVEPDEDLTVEQIQTLNVDEIKHHLKERGLPISGRKVELVQWLTEAIEHGIAIVQDREDGNVIEGNMGGHGFPGSARWELLDGEQERREDIDSIIEGQHFHPPTHQNSDHPPSPKYNYLEEYDRPVYIMSAKVPKRDGCGQPVRNSSGNYIYETQNGDTTLPNIDFCHEHNLGQTSSPCDWFDAFLPVF